MPLFVDFLELAYNHIAFDVLGATSAVLPMSYSWAFCAARAIAYSYT
jgi:hypothetical protein